MKMGSDFVVGRLWGLTVVSLLIKGPSADERNGTRLSIRECTT